MVTGAFLITGCNSGQSDIHADAAGAETGHEGHSHAPGEHGQAVSAGAGETEISNWCTEHSVPESECTKCNPALEAKFRASGNWCEGHGVPESHCRLCNPGIKFPQEEILITQEPEFSGNGIEISLNFRPNAAVCATNDALIQFASAVTAERAGIKVQAVQSAHYESAINAPAEIVFDETGVTVIASTVQALVSRWLISAGDVVYKGDKLAILNSPEIAQLKSSLVAMHARYEVERKELERHQYMNERDLISRAELDRQESAAEQARAEYIGTRGMLLSAGLSESDIDEVIKFGGLSNQFIMRSPSDGLVVERIARLGELIDAGKVFAIVADPRSMWIEARLTEEQIKDVRIGDQLTFSSDGNGIDRIGGEIIWVSRFLDTHTRMGTVRAKVIDPDHALHAGEFGRAKILHATDRVVSLVPKDAVQWEGCCNVVFIKETQDRYRPRKVQLLDGDGPYYQVTDGLRPGEEVVVDGAFLLKTELKKSSIGAGCCGLDPVG